MCRRKKECVRASVFVLMYVRQSACMVCVVCVVRCMIGCMIYRKV